MEGHRRMWGGTILHGCVCGTWSRETRAAPRTHHPTTGQTVRRRADSELCEKTAPTFSSARPAAAGVPAAAKPPCTLPPFAVHSCRAPPSPAHTGQALSFSEQRMVDCLLVSHAVRYNLSHTRLTMLPCTLYSPPAGQALSFSEQQMVDCSWDYENNGCAGGGALGLLKPVLNALA